LVMISLWLSFADQTAPVYFGLYYGVVVVAGLWFGVTGAFLTALCSSLLYAAAMSSSGVLSLTAYSMISTYALQVVFLMVTAGVVSIAMDIQAQERQALATSRAALQQHWQRIRIAQTIDQMIRPPRLPQIQGLDVGFRYRPAAYSVSGEYYDVIRLGPRRAGICIADFAVRWEWGLQYLYAFKNSFRLAARREVSPARVLTQVNQEMEAEIASDPAFQERPYAFASMCYVVIDLDQGQLSYAIAGNEPPVLVSPGGEQMVSLDRAGIVLNVIPDAHYEEASLPVRTGDTLVLFTDGLTEIRDREGEFLGRDGLLSCIAGYADASSAAALAEGVFNCATEFGRDGQRRDDMTLLVVRVTASDLGRNLEIGTAPDID
jgi:phosphoserine phosphatase RsbU/P